MPPSRSTPEAATLDTGASPLDPSIPRKVEEAAYLTAPNAERCRVIMIADALASRLGAAFRPWRMDSAAFFEALRRGGGDHRIDPGPFSRDATARFPDLARAIGDHGAAYQEGLSRLLLEDIRSWIEER